MTRRARAAARFGAVAFGAVALAIAGWFGWHAWQGRDANTAAVVVQDIPTESVPAAETVQTVDTDAPAIVTAGATPMRQRVAIIGLLNKRNGEARELTLRPGEAIRIGDVAVHLRACEKTAPWEPEQLTGAFVQVDVRGVDRRWRRPFSGWLYKEQPNLNVVRHPIYDVWAKSCAMTFPATGPATDTLKAPAASSSAKKSPGTVDADVEPTTPESASDNLTR